jgi:predicted cupin superfamily sugar epimerase
MDRESARWIKRLELTPHPEGGFYRETLRSQHCTTIYYLLEPGTFSAWHRVRGADEVWHHYAGDLLALHQLTDEGVTRTLLGEEVHHLVIAADRWQAAEPVGDRFVLVGCTVAPAFTFERFELGRREALHAAFPAHERWVNRFSRS